jgi:hypothetical protein
MARCHRLVVAGVLSGVFLPAFTAGAAEPAARKAERANRSPRSGARAARPTSAMAPTGLMPAAVFDGLSNQDNFDVYVQ